MIDRPDWRKKGGQFLLSLFRKGDLFLGVNSFLSAAFFYSLIGIGAVASWVPIATLIRFLWCRHDVEPSDHRLFSRPDRHLPMVFRAGSFCLLGCRTIDRVLGRTQEFRRTWRMIFFMSGSFGRDGQPPLVHQKEDHILDIRRSNFLRLEKL